MCGFGGEHAGRHRAGGRADDDLERIAPARTDLGERAQHADLIRRARAAAREHQAQDGPLVEAALGLSDAFVHLPICIRVYESARTVRAVRLHGAMPLNRANPLSSLTVKLRLGDPLAASMLVFALGVGQCRIAAPPLGPPPRLPAAGPERQARSASPTSAASGWCCTSTPRTTRPAAPPRPATSATTSSRSGAGRGDPRHQRGRRELAQGIRRRASPALHHPRGQRQAGRRRTTACCIGRSA